ncbi:hypothetical protein SNK04_010685 [Fusarium graminearum]
MLRVDPFRPRCPLNVRNQHIRFGVGLKRHQNRKTLHPGREARLFWVFRDDIVLSQVVDHFLLHC